MGVIPAGVAELVLQTLSEPFGEGVSQGSLKLDESLRRSGDLAVNNFWSKSSFMHLHVLQYSGSSKHILSSVSCLPVRARHHGPCEPILDLLQFQFEREGHEHVLGVNSPRA